MKTADNFHYMGLLSYEWKRDQIRSVTAFWNNDLKVQRVFFRSRRRPHFDTFKRHFCENYDIFNQFLANRLKTPKNQSNDFIWTSVFRLMSGRFSQALSYRHIEKPPVFFAQILKVDKELNYGFRLWVYRLLADKAIRWKFLLKGRRRPY